MLQLWENGTHVGVSLASKAALVGAAQKGKAPAPICYPAPAQPTDKEKAKLYEVEIEDTNEDEHTV